MIVIFTLHISYDSRDGNIYICSCKMTVIIFSVIFWSRSLYVYNVMCLYIHLYNCKMNVNIFSIFFMVIYGDDLTTLVRPTHGGGGFF